MGKPRDLADLVATGNILADGAVAPAELTGVTSTASELNILDGVTATAAELNLLDGVTATTAELNHVDGVTSNVQTQMDAKAPIASPTFTGTATAPTVNASTALQIGGVAVTATAAELNKMDGVTVSASDINSVTSKAPTSSPTLTGNVTINADSTTPLTVKRSTDEGDMIEFYEGSTLRGRIGIELNDMFITSSNSGLRFDYNNTRVVPCTTTGSGSDGTDDLGDPAVRWKDIYLSGGVVDTTTTVSYASSISLSYTNGAIQTVTLTGNVTFTDGLADGEAIVLMLNAGASHTVTWTAVNYWVSSDGNAAPTLTAKDTIVLWKIGSDVYAAYVGSFA